jgi:predicted flavoprotein YhiN
MKNVHPNGRFLKYAFYNFFSKDIINLLHNYGVETVIERGGRVFPASNKSVDILNALLANVKINSAEIHYNCKVINLLINQYSVTGVKIIEYGQKKQLTANKVIICTGENVKASVWMNGKKQTDAFGEMLFTHFGISGPIILTLSRFIVKELINNNKIDISIDLKPNEGHQITSKERKKIKSLMKDLRFKVAGYRPFKEAIITAGGINTKEIDPKTMQSKLAKNLYFAGEVIDVDANTGGYNLQITYSTGWFAAESCVKSIN